MLSSSDNELYSFNKLHTITFPVNFVDEDKRFLCKYHRRSLSPCNGPYSFDKPYKLMNLDTCMDEDDRFLCNYHSKLKSS